MEQNENQKAKKIFKIKFNNPKVVLPKSGVAIPLVILFLAIWLLLPRQAKFSYDYRKGSEWDYDNLIAQFDFPLLKTSDQTTEDKSKVESTAIPYFRYSEDVVDNNLKGIENLQLGEYSSLKSALYSSLNDIYNKGVVTDDGIKSTKGTELSNDVIYIQKDKKSKKYPVSEVYKITDARQRLLHLMTQVNPSVNMDSILRRSGAYDLIVPNLVYDKQTTELVQTESSSSVSPTQGYISAGELIVSKGEVVTAEIEQILDSYKAEYQQNLGYSGSPLLFWLGNAILSLALVFLFALVIFYTSPSIFKKKNKFAYISLIYLISVIGAMMASKVDSELIYVIPFTLTTLYLQAFFKNKVIVPISIIALIPILIFAKNGSAIYTIFMVGSLVSLLVFKYYEQGWKQFTRAFVVFVSMAIVYLGFRMVDLVSGNPYNVLIYLLIGSVLSVMGYPLIFLFEKIFNLVSQNRLLELANVGANPFLLEFEHVAPGTFQHSQGVENMVDRVARKVDANVNLLKAAALYHDIGKMNHPEYFTENEGPLNVTENIHDHLSYEESARIIVNHVSDGMALAKQIKLPDEISDFILTHHGTTKAGYFWAKYINEGGDPNNTEPFTYPGKTPQTTEQAILMICDSLQAASKNLADHSPEAHIKFVQKIVQGKLMEGQLDDCEISIGDLKKVEDTLAEFLNEEYHKRIAYPDIKR